MFPAGAVVTKSVGSLQLAAVKDLEKKARAKSGGSLVRQYRRNGTTFYKVYELYSHNRMTFWSMVGLTISKAWQLLMSAIFGPETVMDFYLDGYEKEV